MIPNVNLVRMASFVGTGMPGRADFGPEITQRQDVLRRQVKDFNAAP